MCALTLTRSVVRNIQGSSLQNSFIFNNLIRSSHLSSKTLPNMVQAKWNGAVIAEADDDKVVLLEGNTYFPPSAVKAEYFKQNKETSTCPWKGTCIYFDITVNGKTNASASWVYPTPKEKAMNIKGHYAFWKGVQIG